MVNKQTTYLGIQEWYAPEDKSCITADVIAVHGLAAHPYWTWMGINPSNSSHQSKTSSVNKHDRQSNGVPWLQTLLPTYLPNCRIITFGFQCNYFNNAPKRNIANCAHEMLLAIDRDRTCDLHKKRPIIFLSHSFGGIVVKEAMIKATLAEDRFGSIRVATRGVVFLGTPHSGISAASDVDVLLSMLRACGHSADRQLIRSLRKSSSELLRLNTLFDDVRHNLQVHCFYELLPFKFSVVAVGQPTATMPGVPAEPLMTDHSGLNKYTEVDDPDLQKIGKVLQDMKTSLESARKHDSLVPGEPPATVMPANSDIGTIYGLVTAVEPAMERISENTSVLQETRYLLVCRLWFQTWAYMLGLTAIKGSQRSLHETMNVAKLKATTRSLQSLMQLFEEDFSGSEAVSTLPHVDAAFQDLGVQSNPVQMNSTRHVLIMASLANEDTICPYEDVLYPHATPDLQTLGAMTRIDTWIETSLGRKSDQDSFIDLNLNIKQDIVRSRSHTSGILTQKRNGKRSSREILIEWKRYDETWDIEIGNVLFNRVELLTEFLRLASKGKEAAVFRIMECLGYCHDRRKNQIGFVFGVPKTVASRSAYIRLNTLIKAYNNQQCLPPSVSDRIELARILCSAMFACHATNWFHRGFSSHNIIVYSEVDMPDSGEENEDQPPLRDLQNYSILSPFIAGFVSSRPVGQAEISEVTSLCDEERRYQHPSYSAQKKQKFLHEFDYFSLGVVLLEVGQWRPLSAIMQNKIPLANCSMEDFATCLRTKKASHLNSHVGDVFQHVVCELLDAFRAQRSHMDPNEYIDFGEVLRFQTDILDALESRRV